MLFSDRLRKGFVFAMTLGLAAVLSVGVLGCDPAEDTQQTEITEEDIDAYIRMLPPAAQEEISREEVRQRLEEQRQQND